MTLLFRLKIGAVVGLTVWSAVLVVFYLATRPITPLFVVVRAGPSIGSRIRPPLNHTTLSQHGTNAYPPGLAVVMAAAGDELGGMIAAVNSAFTNTKSRVHFHLVTSKDEASHLKTWIMSTHLHRMTYTLREVGESKVRRVKIDFAQLFPEIEGKMIFLDCDVIIKGDLLDLYNTPIYPGHSGAFVTDCSKSGLKQRYGSIINIHHKSYTFTPDPNKCAFNSGVFVTNVSSWRAENLTERLQGWVDVHRQEPITSLQGSSSVIEAAMFIELYGKTSPIDPSWNIYNLGTKPDRRYSKQFIDSAKLVHWSGHWKPWHHRTAYSEIWERYFVPDPTGLFRPTRLRGPAKI